MKKYIKYLIGVFILVLCTGCNANYTLTFVDNKFSEEVTIHDISDDDRVRLDRLTANEEYLKFDEANSYQVTDNDDNFILSYDIGDELVKTKLLKYCFDDVYIIDKDDYIYIETDGENKCSDYDIKFTFKTDKEVFRNNANKIDKNTYIWNNFNDGVDLLFSKSKPWKNRNELGKNVLYLVIVSVIVAIFIGIVFYFYKKNNLDNN